MSFDKKEYGKNYRKIHKWESKNYDYDIMFIKQNGVCAICGRKETTKSGKPEPRLSVDHNHKTNKVRGLLCRKCNAEIGWFEMHTDKILKYMGVLV